MVCKDQLPWISPEIQQEIARCNWLLKRHRKSQKQQGNKVTLLKRKGIEEFCSNATSNVKHPGEFWKKMKPELVPVQTEQRYISRGWQSSDGAQ